MVPDLMCRLRRMFGSRSEVTVAAEEQSARLENKRIEVDRLLTEVSHLHHAARGRLSRQAAEGRRMDRGD